MLTYVEVCPLSLVRRKANSHYRRTKKMMKTSLNAYKGTEMGPCCARILFAGRLLCKSWPKARNKRKREFIAKLCLIMTFLEQRARSAIQFIDIPFSPQN
jgi:hypothetical protein